MNGSQKTSLKSVQGIARARYGNFLYARDVRRRTYIMTPAAKREFLFVGDDAEPAVEILKECFTMKRSLLVFMLLTALLCVSVPASADGGKAAKVQQLSAVEVTGSRVADSIADVPAQTYVLTDKEIAQSGATNLADALARVPGVSSLVNNNGLAFQRSVSVRGFTTEVSVLVDGVQYTNPLHGAGEMGAPNLNTIPLESIERIEIVKGAGSALYGSDAGGAVINVITKKGAEKTSAYLKAEGGNGGYFRGSFRGTVAEDGLVGTVGYSRTVENDDHVYDVYGSKLKSFYGNDYVVRLEKGKWAFSGSFGDSESAYDSFDTWYGTGFNEIGRKDKYARLNLQYKDARTTGRVFYNKAEYDYPLEMNPSGLYYNKFDTESLGLTFNRKELFDKWKLVWGADVRRDKVDYKNYVDPSADYDLARTNTAPYLEANLMLGEANLDLGLRFDHWNVNNGETENQLLPRIALSWANKNDVMFYASAGRFFSMPTFYQLMGETSMWVSPNPELNPEKGWSFELGTKAASAKNPWSFNVFYTMLDDAIVFDYDPETYISQYKNVNEKRAWGAEGKYTWNFAKNWSYAQQLSYTRAEEKAQNSSDWTRSTDPRWDVAGFLNYNNKNFDAEINWHLYADREFTYSAAPEVDDGSIFLVNASLNYKWKNETLRFACTNLFDKKYYTNASGYLGAERRVIFSWQHEF